VNNNQDLLTGRLMHPVLLITSLLRAFNARSADGLGQSDALAHRLRKKSIHFEQQYPIEVYDEDGTLLGHFVTDFLIERQLVVELKACTALVPEHTAQILGYLRGTRLQHGLLINFGASKLQIKKLIL